MSTSYQGGWVFKDGAILYGPVPTELLVSKLESGEIGPETLVAKESGAFSPIGTVEPFIQVAARAAAERRTRLEAERRAGGRKIRRIAWSVVALAGIGCASTLILWNRDPTLGHRELAEIHIEVLPIVVEAFPVEAMDDGMEVYQEDLWPTARGGQPAGAPPRPPATPAAARARAMAGPTPAPASQRGSPLPHAGGDDVSIVTQFDEGAIQLVVQSNRGKLLPCLRDQAGKDPTFRGDLPLAFVVGNGGRVTKLWIDKTGYRKGELFDCILGQLSTWRFPTFEGQSPAISLTFRVGG